MEPPLELWADALEQAITGSRHLRRVRVVRETGSTQDAARLAAGGVPGLLLTTSRQSGGRGRLGRAWEQRADLGLAATFVLPAGDSRRLSTIAGLAALDACRSGGAAAAGLKAPNDVVVPVCAAPFFARGSDPRGSSDLRKLAGVLVEQDESLALMGIGINVAQRADDFSPEVAHRATSLRLLGATPSRLEVLLALVRALERRLDQDGASLDAAWRAALVPTSAWRKHETR